MKLLLEWTDSVSAVGGSYWYESFFLRQTFRWLIAGDAFSWILLTLHLARGVGRCSQWISQLTMLDGLWTTWLLWVKMMDDCEDGLFSDSIELHPHCLDCRRFLSCLRRNIEMYVWKHLTKSKWRFYQICGANLTIYYNRKNRNRKKSINYDYTVSQWGFSICSE